jgi:hypothetical protein
MRLAALFALASSGCSLLFDPASLTPPDAGAPDAARDLAAPPADLAPPPDLAPEDCGVPTFRGFPGDAGADARFDCRRCGCLLDDFANGIDPLRWTATLTPNWSITPGGGALALSHAAVAGGEGVTLSSDGHFYLEGDFVFRMDYGVDHWVSVAAVLVVVGGRLDTDLGIRVPVAIAEDYVSLAGEFQYAALDRSSYQLPADPITPGVTRTFELRRHGTTLCAAVPGFYSICRPSTTGAVYVAMVAAQPACNDPSCPNGPSLSVRLSQPRLVSGQIVSQR